MSKRSIQSRSGARGVNSPLVLALDSHAPLGETEVALVERGLGDARLLPANAEIWPVDGLRTIVVLVGWAAEVALLADGRRQIVSLLLPGEIVDLGQVARRGLVVVALTDLQIRDVTRLAETVATLDPEDSALAQAWTLSRHAAERRLVRHVVRLGRLPAYDRVVDLLVDLHERQQRAGLADTRSMSLPLTQEAIADHIGLSIVHVNRTMQQLRRDRLIASQQGRVTLDPARLAAWAADRRTP